VSDSYQPIYDAVCRQIHNGNIGQAVENAVGRPDIEFHFRMMSEEFRANVGRPSVLFRPALSRDGNQWCALYGASLIEGVAGFGDTPSQAMFAFDQAWFNETVPTTSGGQESRGEG